MLQAILNQQAIDKLTRVSDFIKKADKFEANQMTCMTLRECLNSRVSIDDMNSEELKSFEDQLIKSFRNFQWVK